MEESTAAVGSGIMVSAGRSSCRRVTAASSSEIGSGSGFLPADPFRTAFTVDCRLPIVMELSQSSSSQPEAERKQRNASFDAFEAFEAEERASWSNSILEFEFDLT
jgi:hypothetical protein